MSTYFIDTAKDYASYHTRSATKIIHAIGLILTFFSLQIFFGFIQISMTGVFSTDLAWILSLGLLAYYFTLNKALAISLAPIFYLFNLAAAIITSKGPSTGAVESCFFLFLFGVIAQFIGHAYETKRPPLKTNLTHLFLSPLFLIAEAFFYFSMMLGLYYEIYEIDETAIATENKKRIEENREEIASDSTVERRSKKR